MITQFEVEVIHQWVRNKIEISKCIDKLGQDQKVHLVEMTLRELYLELVNYVWGHKLEDIIIKYPEDWWEALKDRFLPKFLRSKILVRYKIHHIKLYDCYPELKLPMKFGRTYRYPIYQEISKEDFL